MKQGKRNGKILGSFSGMRKYLEKDMLADSLKGRIRYGCTAYVGMDHCRIFEVCIDGRQIKRFSWESLQSYFIENGYKGESHHSGPMGYWEGFWDLWRATPAEQRTAYTDEEFCQALAAYRSQPIGESLTSTDPIQRMFAVLDRRVGKRTLEKIRDTAADQPEWLQLFYCLRLKAEGME